MGVCRPGAGRAARTELEPADMTTSSQIANEPSSHGLASAEIFRSLTFTLC